VRDLCVLVVEDEPLIRLLVTEEFADAGFDVQEAANGDAAMTLIQNPPTRFTLLVTDIHMPGKHDGIAVAQLMRRQFPLVPVIFTTGRPDVLNSIQPLARTDALLVKPFLPSVLLREARRLLTDATRSPGH
jgi:DNA-binding response OmpR family regulator